MDPFHYLALAVFYLDPMVTAWRAPAAVVLFVIVAFRPQHPSRCIMLGRVLVLMACVNWVAAAVPDIWPAASLEGLSACAKFGDWVMFGSAMASHVCEVATTWGAVIEAKRRESPSPFARIWAALLHRPPRSPLKL